ncbi:hypothetical protein D9G31_27060 [Escherichia coli]|nr:hypothetical protein [Escherichia coli]
MTAQIAAYGRLVADPQLKTTSKGTQMAMAEYGREYMKRKTKHGLRSNVTLTEDSEDWMPSCASVTNDDGKN